MALGVEFDASRKLDRYFIEEHIGNGTYGCVYRAVDTQDGKTVVVKFGSEHDKQKDYKYLNNELQVLRNLHHQNIVRLLDFTIVSEDDKENLRDQHSALVLENCICDLQTVREIIPSLSHPAIKTIAKQLFQGLEYLETVEMIHCDIKPQNLLLSSDGELKLCDFGFARPSGFHDVRPGFTIPYSPIEVLLGARRLDHKVDSWSAGCIIAELFMGELLFEDCTITEQVSAICDLCGITKRDWKEMRSMLPKRYKREKMRYRARTLDAKLKDFVQDRPTGELISQLLVANPKCRWSAKQALASSYFQHRPRPLPDLKSLVCVVLDEYDFIRDV